MEKLAEQSKPLPVVKDLESYDIGGLIVEPSIGEVIDMAESVADMDELAVKLFGSAACAGVDPDLFFPERGASLKEAQRICGPCSIRQECLSWAVLLPERHGVWGGSSELWRKIARRRLRKRPSNDAARRLLAGKPAKPEETETAE